MTLQVAPPDSSEGVYGAEYPRIAPPLPLRTRVDAFELAAESCKIKPYPWQLVAARYLMALGPGDRPLYREVTIVVGRQNGKTTLLVPYVVDALRRGLNVMHTAQNTRLPQDVFNQVGDVLEPQGATVRISNGKESITMPGGAKYRIVAATRGAARGPANDIVIVDELREFDDWSFISAAKPTMTASKHPQMVYLSNAGEEHSLVLNALKARGADDPNLAYLEWSADPDLPADSMTAWTQANPSIGHNAAILDTLEADYIADKLAGTLALFETEHLCRWVDTLQVTYVHPNAWQMLHGKLEEPRRPYMAVSMDPTGTRASAVIAWRMTSGHVGVKVIADVTGTPIDTDALGTDLKKLSTAMGVVGTGFDPWTDTDLARRLPRTKPLAGRDYAVASENFARRVSDGSIRWDGADVVGIDLGWTTRKSHESGAFQAVRSSDDHSVTAALAAIRAVWLATNEKPPSPKVL